MRLFSAEELEQVIVGTPELDFEGLERSAHYEDGFQQSSEVCARVPWSHQLHVGNMPSSKQCAACNHWVAWGAELRALSPLHGMLTVHL